MKFRFNQTVMQGRTRYEVGSEDVPFQLAHYFAMNGWIDAADAEAEAIMAELRGDADGESLLSIQSATIGNSNLGI